MHACNYVSSENSFITTHIKTLFTKLSKIAANQTAYVCVFEPKIFTNVTTPISAVNNLWLCEINAKVGYNLCC